VGLDGILNKIHVSAKVLSYAVAIEEAVQEVEKNIPQRIRDQVSSVLESEKESG